MRYTPSAAPYSLFGACSLIAIAAPLTAQSFGPEQLIATNLGAASFVTTVDINGDGRDDVLAASLLDDVAWYPNLGGGEMGSAIMITAGLVYPYTVGYGDLDGDLDVDVVTTSQTGNTIGISENLGGGLFSPRVVFATTTENVYLLSCVDLDDDGFLDVLVSMLGSTNGGVSWFRGLGDGTFGTVRVVNNAPSCRSAVGVDLNQDGLLDVLYSSHDEDKVAWHENLGGGLFGNEQLISAAAMRVATAVAADLDGDGDPDVLFASRDGVPLQWSENLGSGSFGVEQPIQSLADDPRSLTTADLDDDGDLDVIWGSTGGGLGADVAWNENLGGGMFAPDREISSNSNQTFWVHAGDLDTDGGVDVLSASFGDSKIAWYRNLTYSSPGIGERDCSLGFRNSTGMAAQIVAQGSLLAGDNDIVLVAERLPASSFGFFLTSEHAGLIYPISGSQGALCLGGFLGRYVGPGQIQSSGPLGSFLLVLDLNAMPTALGFATADPGETWHFQAWYRDANPGPTSNFTDAVSVTFL